MAPTTRKSTRPSLSKKRGPLHCRQCPNAPLVKECPKHGAKYKKERIAQAMQDAGTSQTLSAPPIHLQPSTEPQNTTLHTTTTFDSFVPEISNRTPSVDYSSAISTPRTDSPLRTPRAQRRGTDSEIFTQLQGIIPIQLFPSGSPPSTPRRAESSSHVGTSPNTSPLAPSSSAASSPTAVSIMASNSPGATSFTVASTPTSTPSKKIRATLNNPKFGVVEGAMRGAQKCTIIRPRPLRPLATTTEASTRFRREMPNIISRVERLALETNGWFFVAGQHPNASSNNSFLHYASPAMVDDAWVQTSSLINGFGGAVQGLLAFNKQKVQEQTVEMNERYMEAKQQKEAALVETRRTKEALEKQMEHSARLLTMIEQLRDGTLSIENMPPTMNTPLE